MLAMGSTKNNSTVQRTCKCPAIHGGTSWSTMPICKIRITNANRMIWTLKKSTNMFEKTLKMYHHEINIFLSIFNDWCLFLFRPSDIKIFPSNCCKTNNDLVHWRPWTPLVFDILRPFIHLTGSWYELCKTVSRTPGPFCYDGGSVQFRTPTVSSSTQNNLQKLK